MRAEVDIRCQKEKAGTLRDALWLTTAELGSGRLRILRVSASTWWRRASGCPTPCPLAARESPAFAPPSWPVLWSAMAADRHPQAKAHKDGRKAENEKRDAGARDGRQPEVAVDSPKDDATASQGDGKCNRTPHRVGSFRLLSLPFLSLFRRAARHQADATHSC